MQGYFMFLCLNAALAFVRRSEQGGCCSIPREPGCDAECPPPRLPSSPPPPDVQSTGRFVTMRQDIQEAADRTAPDASGNELAFNIHRYLKTRSYGDLYHITINTWNPATSSSLLVPSNIVNQRELGTSAGFWTNACNQRPFPPDRNCKEGGSLVQRISDRMYAMVTWAPVQEQLPRLETLGMLMDIYQTCTEYLGGNEQINGPVSLAGVALCFVGEIRQQLNADPRGILVLLNEGPNSVNQGFEFEEGTLFVRSQGDSTLVRIYINREVGQERIRLVLGTLRLGVFILPPRS